MQHFDIIENQYVEENERQLFRAQVLVTEYIYRYLKACAEPSIYYFHRSQVLEK